MKQTIEIPEGFELKKISDTEYQIVKKEAELPDTWEEFCKSHSKCTNEYYINSDSVIINHDLPGKRACLIDRNLLPNQNYAEAVRALCQLIQLRDCYRQGWKPIWEDDSLKYVINFIRNGIIDLSACYCSKNIFSFQSEEIRDKFFVNFKDLLETASYLWK